MMPSAALATNQSGQSIELRDVCKSWGDAIAVQDINLDVEPGSFTVLLGPSGCGKSTTLRIIAGLEAADSGEVRIGSKEVSQQPPSRRDIAMVFQSYALFPHLSVAENILFGLKVRRTRKAEQESRLAQTAELLGLTDYLHRKPSQLSGGQQQRVALGRAIIAEKPVCLMDEPLSNLDAKLRNTMRTEIRELQQSLGFSMVYVTHDQSEAITMADQVVLMRNGRIEQASSPRQIYEQPASTFVAGFIGTPPMNLCQASELLTHCIGTERATTPENRAPDNNVSDKSVVDKIVAPQLTVGIRPEHIGLDHNTQDNRHPSVDPQVTVKATVENIEYLGADMLVKCRLSEHSLLARVPGSSQIKTGNSVSLTWLASNMHFFEGEKSTSPDIRSGIRIQTPDAQLVNVFVTK